MQSFQQNSIVIMLSKRVQVLTHIPLEQNGGLWDHADGRPELMQSDLRNIHSIYGDHTLNWLHYTEQQDCERRLPGSRSAHDSNSLPCGYVAIELANDERQPWSVSQAHSSKRQLPRRWPPWLVLTWVAEHLPCRPRLRGHSDGSELQQSLQRGETVISHHCQLAHNPQEIRGQKTVRESQTAHLRLHDIRRQDQHGCHQREHKTDIISEQCAKIDQR
mmetsp:Transcript_38253/g.83596  ORF Transcript_38253/g.83596 Transcript_38253/m.83596 type:complete len:218 (+) Transcript_38253:471-1124(+)